MAKFVSTPSPNGKTVYWINVENIRAIQEATNGGSVIHFDGEHTLPVQSSARDIIVRAEGED